MHVGCLQVPWGPFMREGTVRWGLSTLLLLQTGQLPLGLSDIRVPRENVILKKKEDPAALKENMKSTH